MESHMWPIKTPWVGIVNVNCSCICLEQVEWPVSLEVKVVGKLRKALDSLESHRLKRPSVLAMISYSLCIGGNMYTARLGRAVTLTWGRHQMETFSAFLALCAGNSSVTGKFATQRPVTRSFDVFFDLPVNKTLSKQSWGGWFETPANSLWRHCNELWHDYRKLRTEQNNVCYQWAKKYSFQ